MNKWKAYYWVVCWVAFWIVCSTVNSFGLVSPEDISAEEGRKTADIIARKAYEQSKLQKRVGSGGTQNGKAPSRKAKIKKSATTEMMELEVVDEPVTNLFRLISKTYQMNIIPLGNLEDIRITIHLENISVMEGLQIICQANQLEMTEGEGVYYIGKASERTINEMHLHAKRIDIQVENQPVKQFIKEFSQKTKVSIVPGQNLEGNITGHLQNVLPVQGLKALMAANNFSVRKKSGIYLVENRAEEESGSRRRGRSSRSRFSRRGGMDIDIQDGLVSVSLKNANLADAVREITEIAELNMVTYGQVEGQIDAEFKDVPVNRALSVLLQGTKYTYVFRDGMILIGERNPKSPSGKVLSTVEIHHLKYVRADEVSRLFPKSLSSDGITVLKEQNAILITGTAEDVHQVQEFLTKVDLPTPQVSIEVLIVEYDRGNQSDLGVNNNRINATSPEGASVLPPQVGFTFPKGEYREKDWSYGPFKGAIAMLTPDWQLQLQASLSKSKGKVLARPKITTLNGNPANLQVQRTFYFNLSSVSKDGEPINNLRTVNDGITIDLTPWVTQHGDINLEIKPTIKTTSPPQNAGQPEPVTDRTISTNVRLLDGETLILGGLMDSKETINRSFVPILGSIPILGYLFSSRNKFVQTTEMVIYVTPHILNDETRSINLEDEFKRLNKRKGLVKDQDFLNPSKVKSKEKKEKETPSKNSKKKQKSEKQEKEPTSQPTKKGSKATANKESVEKQEVKSKQDKWDEESLSEN